VGHTRSLREAYSVSGSTATALCTYPQLTTATPPSVCLRGGGQRPIKRTSGPRLDSTVMSVSALPRHDPKTRHLINEGDIWWEKSWSKSKVPTYVQQIEQRNNFFGYVFTFLKCIQSISSSKTCHDPNILDNRGRFIVRANIKHTYT